MLLISISTFICIAFGVMAIYWLMFRPASVAATRLKEFDEPRGGGAVTIEHTQIANFAERIADPISRLLPPSAANAKKLQKQRSEELTSELQSQSNLVCRLLLEK